MTDSTPFPSLNKTKINFNVKCAHAHGHMDRYTEATKHSFIAPDILPICSKMTTFYLPYSKDICTQTYAWSTPFLRKNDPTQLLPQL